MENKLFVTLPTGSEGLVDLTPLEKLVYLGIKSFMNKDTMEAFPSHKAIAKRIGATAPTVASYIKKLVDKNYIKTEKRGRGTVYIFNKAKLFEPFSYDFLNLDMKFLHKALLAASLEFMYDKESGFGKMSYNHMQWAKKINMPYSTLVRNSQELLERHLITLKLLSSTDTETGCSKVEMKFDMPKYGQAIVATLLNHENRLDDLENVVYNNVLFSESLFEALTEEQKKVVLDKYNEKVAQYNS